MQPNNGADQAQPADQAGKVIEVHNAWTVYARGPDGTPAAKTFTQIGRPQDWGAPHWIGERFRFDWYTAGVQYINHVWCWIDVPIDMGDRPGVFAELITLIAVPGSDPRFCGRQYLHPDDMWDPAWGAQPPEADPGEWVPTYPDH